MHSDGLPTKVELPYVALQKDGRQGIRLRSFQGDEGVPHVDCNL